MDYRKLTMIASGLLYLAIALAPAAEAQPAKQMRLRGNAGDGFGIRQFAANLRLAEAQRQEIRAILKSRQAEILAARENLLRARIALLNKDPDGPRILGEAQARTHELRQTIARQIETKLTAEQLATLEKRRQRQADRLNRRLLRLAGRGAS